MTSHWNGACIHIFLIISAALVSWTCCIIQIFRECKGGKAKAVIHDQFQPSYFSPWLHIASLAAVLTCELVTHASHQ